MTIPLTGAGSLFVRLGHLAGRMADVNALRGAAATARVLSGAAMPTRFGVIEADYLAGTPLYNTVNGVGGSGQNLWSILASWQGGEAAIFQNLAALARQTLTAMYNLDAGLIETAGSSPALALQTLIQQMTASADSVNASVPTVGAQTAVGTPAGNPVAVTSLKNGQGSVLQYILPETLTLQCSSDSQTGGAAAGNETLSLRGQAGVSDLFSQSWPAGSGVSGTLAAIDGGKSNNTGNLLQNSDFVTNTTANLPDNWNLLVGAQGVDIFCDPANAYTVGGGALKFTGTGAALADAIVQLFATTPSSAVGAGGTSPALQPNTVYHFNCWTKVSATPTAGVLEIALVDATTASPYTVIADDATTNNVVTKSLTAVSTTYVNANGAFRTPMVLPTKVGLRVRLSTPIDSGKSCFVGRLSCARAGQLYAPAGPFLTVHSGNARMVNGLTPDTWTLAVSNTMGQFQRWLNAIFNLGPTGLTIPNSGAPTIADSLIA